jgi:hypothetical protein
LKADSALTDQLNEVSHGADSRAATALEADSKRERKLTLVILLVAGLARLPFLWHGFGGHPDEWLVIRSGLDLWLNGSYFPSRVPGYPFNEIIMGGLAWLGGATACAAAAAVASLVMLVYLRGLAPLQGVRDSFWMVLAFSFEPWVWSSSTHALDYIWGICSLVAALYYVERRQFGAAGLACAIGFGFRPSSLLWIGPLFIRVILVERHWHGILRFALWAAVPALVPASIMISIVISRPDAWADTHVESVRTIKHFLVPSSIAAIYHFIELMGHFPAVLLIIAGCYAGRDRLFGLFRSHEGWVWTYLLIFVCLFAVFVIESSKTEYMLPALPGLFIILGRCISNNWWKAITAAFIFNAFVSFGFGHADRTEGIRLELTAPTLRPGALLWYAERAKESNDRAARTGSELSEPARIVRAEPGLDRLDDFYVSSLLKRGPAGQARISCPLIPARLSFPKGSPPDISPSKDLAKPFPSYYPMLVCCPSTSALILSDTPSSQTDQLEPVVQRFCASETGVKAATSAARP